MCEHLAPVKILASASSSEQIASFGRFLWRHGAVYDAEAPVEFDKSFKRLHFEERDSFSVDWMPEIISAIAVTQVNFVCVLIVPTCDRGAREQELTVRPARPFDSYARSAITRSCGARLSMPVTKRKATGAHTTPRDVSRLVAERATALVNRLKGPLGALDPACGDGNLL